MPPRRIHRHRDIEDLYRREDAEQMEQRIRDRFDERCNASFNRMEKMLAEWNQNRRRGSPESSHHGERMSRHSERDERNDRERGSVHSQNRDQRENQFRKVESNRKRTSGEEGNSQMLRKPCVTPKD